MVKEDKEIVAEEINNEKLKVLLMPVSIGSVIHGLQLLWHPDILLRYHIYNLLNSLINVHAIGMAFIIVGSMVLSSFLANSRTTLRISSTILFALWSMLTVAFFISPPPNTVWIFCAILTYFSFSLTRRV